MNSIEAKPRFMSLYETTGPNRAKHRLVLYFKVETDWPAKNLERNGNTRRPLIKIPMTEEADRYCNDSFRARSLRYGGDPKEVLRGLLEDLRTFKVSEEVIKNVIRVTAQVLQD